MARPRTQITLDELERLEQEHGSLEKAGGYRGLSARTLQRHARDLGRNEQAARKRAREHLKPGGFNRSAISDEDLVDGLVVHDGSDRLLAKTLGLARSTVWRRRKGLPLELRQRLSRDLDAWRQRQAEKAAQSTRTGERDSVRSP